MTFRCVSVTETSQVLSNAAAFDIRNPVRDLSRLGSVRARVPDGLVADVRHWVGARDAQSARGGGGFLRRTGNRCVGARRPGQSQPATWILVRRAGIDYRILGICSGGILPTNK